MDGEISISRKLQTEGIVAAAAKRERGSGTRAASRRNSPRSENPLKIPITTPRPTNRPMSRTPSPSPESAASAICSDDAGLLDFEA